MLNTARRFGSSLLALFGEPVTFGLHPEDAGPFFARQGFRTREVADAVALGARYFTPPAHIYPTNYLVHAIVSRR